MGIVGKFGPTSSAVAPEVQGETPALILCVGVQNLFDFFLKKFSSLSRLFIGLFLKIYCFRDTPQTKQGIGFLSLIGLISPGETTNEDQR